jgi:O-antigen/teichoic acid export membrane protein
VRRQVARASEFLTGSGGGLVHKVVRSGVWVGLSSFGQSLLQTLRSVILARLLTPEIFGLMGLCQVAIRGLDLFTETGIAPALIHRQERVEEARDTAYVLQVLRGFLLAVLVIPVAPLAAWFYGEPRLLELILVLSSVFVISGFSNITIVLLQKRLDFRRLTILDLTVAIVSTIVIAGLAYYLRSVWALVIGQIFTAALKVVLSFTIVPGRPAFRFDRVIAWELFRYGRFITGLTMALFVTSEIDNMVVGKVLGFEALGLYSMAFTLANLPATHIAKVSASVIFPAYSTLQNSPERMRIAYLTVLRVVAGLAFPAAVGLAVLAPEVLAIVYGAKWIDAAGPLQILSLFGAARAVSLLGGYLYNAIGKPSISFYLVTTKLAIILAIIYPMTTTFGTVGAALAMSVPQVLLDSYSFYVIKREIALPLRSIVVVLLRALAASGVMALAVVLARRWLSPVSGADLAVLILVGGLIYVALSLREIKQLYTLLRQRRTPEPRPTPEVVPSNQ